MTVNETDKNLFPYRAGILVFILRITRENHLGSQKWLLGRTIPHFFENSKIVRGFSGGSGVRNPPANAGDMGSIPESGKSSREENGNPLQYPCLGNPINRGTWGVQSIGLQRLGHNLATQKQQNQAKRVINKYCIACIF